jgi:hypothetical protein
MRWSFTRGAFWKRPTSEKRAAVVVVKVCVSFMSNKPKPLLHLVRGGEDPEVYNADLDFFFGELDSECGLKSVGASGVEKLYLDSGNTRKAAGGAELTAKTGKHSIVADTWPYTDANIKSFGRGRRIWSRISALPYFFQELLREYYTPRQWPDSPVHTMSKQVVRAAHRAYVGLT